MSAFRVGQRVRLIAPIPGRLASDSLVKVGVEGTVVGPDAPFHYYDYTVVFDTHKSNPHYCYARELAPLTDPGADAFLERMRKLKPYDEPKVEPVRQGTPIWK